MSEELTITQATERLQSRGIDVARRTVASWVEQGMLTSRLVETPAGNYWVIPAREVESFQPPKPGRPPKSAGAGKRASNGRSIGKKRGGKK